MRRILRLLFGEFRISWFRTLAQLLGGRRILVGHRFKVFGRPEMADAAARLSLGTLPYGFASGTDVGVLRVRGHMSIRGHVAIGVGSRVDVGPDARLEVGEDTYFSPYVKVVVSERVRFGRHCAVGWNVQVLDDDQHLFDNGNGNGPKGRSAPITIGDRVWIGSGAMVFKGVEIADGCVVAGGAVVTRSVTEPGCLIAGNPARVVRRGVHWS